MRKSLLSLLIILGFSTPLFVACGGEEVYEEEPIEEEVEEPIEEEVEEVE